MHLEEGCVAARELLAYWEAIAPLPRVVVESPLRNHGVEGRAYARAAVLDCLARNEAPMASHVLYPAAGLDDSNRAQRMLGMHAGWAHIQGAALVAVYEDLGITDGMRQGMLCAVREGVPVEFRTVPGWQ